MAARKSSSGSRRPRGRKRAPAKTSRNRRKKPAKQHSLLFKLCFWPFLLANHFTRNWHPVLKWPARAVASVGLVLLFCMTLVAFYYYARSTEYDLDKVAEMPARTVVYSRDGQTELGQLHGDNALVAREDARFYQHGAVDIRGIARVVKRFFLRGKREGASTITMQLARNTFPLGGRNLDRKLLEIAVAFRISRSADATSTASCWKSPSPSALSAGTKKTKSSSTT